MGFSDLWKPRGPSAPGTAIVPQVSYGIEDDSDSDVVSAALRSNRSMQAASGPRYEDPLRQGHADFALTPEQRTVDGWVDQVGWLGYFVDVVATLGAGVDLVPEVWDGDDWVQERTPLMNGLLQSFMQPADALKPAYRSQRSWLRANLERHMRIGEYAVWPDVENGQFKGWFTAHPDTMGTGQREGEFVARFRPNARPENRDGSYQRGRLDELMRFWNPDPRYPYMARVPIHRIKREVRAYTAACMRVEGDAASRLLSGLLWIETTEADAAAFAAHSAPESGRATPPGGGLPQLIQDYGRHAKRSIMDGLDADLVSKVAPFLWPHHSEPKVVTLGSEVDKEALNAMAAILEHAARGLNIPMDFLTAGVGESNHWNSAEKRRALLNQAVLPVVEDDLEFWSARWRIYLKHLGMPPHECEHQRIGYDATNISLRDDNVAQVLSAHRLIGFRRGVLARVVGQTEADLVPLPEGVDEDEWTLERITPGPQYGQFTAQRDDDELDQRNERQPPQANPNPPTDEVTDPGDEPVTDQRLDA